MDTSAPVKWTLSANCVNGGFGGWMYASDDSCSPYFLAIRNTFINVLYAMFGKQIGSRYRDVTCHISTWAATTICNTGEMCSYVKAGLAKEAIEPWLLPKYYAGVEIVVEEDFPFDDSVAFFTTRPGIEPPMAFMVKEIVPEKTA